MHLPLMQHVLDIAPVAPTAWFKLLGLAMILLLVMEVFKLVRTMGRRDT